MSTETVMKHNTNKDSVSDVSYTDPLKPLEDKFDKEHKNMSDIGFVGTKEEYK